MSEQPVIVNKFSWRDLCPWMIIFRCLPVAVSIPVLIWATVGLVLTPMGWIVLDKVFINDLVRDNNPHIAELAELNRSPYRSVFRTSETGEGYVNVLGNRLSGPGVVFEQTVKPFRALFGSRGSVREFMYLFGGCLWSLAVWSFVGLAICRTALLRLTRDEVISLDDSFDFAVEKFKDGVGAVALPLLAVAGLCIPAGIIGLLMGFDFGVLLAGLLWIVVLAIGLMISLLLLGLLFGWPLMIASVSAEGQNSFDAMTRAYAYVFQRPLHYLFYSLIAVLFGGLCWLVVSHVTNRVVDMSYWAASWGTNVFDGDRIDMIKDGFVPPQIEITPSIEPTTSSLTPRRSEAPFQPSFSPSFSPSISPSSALALGGLSQGGAAQFPDTRPTEAQRPESQPTITQTDPGIPNPGGRQPGAELPQTQPPMTQNPPTTEGPSGRQDPVAQGDPGNGAAQADDPGGRIGPIQLPPEPSADQPNVEVANLDIRVSEYEESSMMYAGRKIIGFWNGLARTLAAAFIYGLFWCMASAIYLLLRKDVDETEMDEIYLVDERRTYDLPPLKSDEHGIPQVQTPVPSDDDDSFKTMTDSDTIIESRDDDEK